MSIQRTIDCGAGLTIGVSTATQADVDQAYRNWLAAANAASVGGTPAVEALWQRFARLDDEVNGKL